jgi:hypothetical protein
MYLSIMLNYVEIGSQYWFLRPMTFVSPKIIILTAESDNLVDEKSRKYYQSRKSQKSFLAEFKCRKAKFSFKKFIRQLCFMRNHKYRKNN